MVRLGRYFNAPSRRASRQWLKVEILFTFGERFIAGNSGLGSKCDTLPSTVSYLVENGHPEPESRGRLKQIVEQRRPPLGAGGPNQARRRTKR